MYRRFVDIFWAIEGTLFHPANMLHLTNLNYMAEPCYSVVSSFANTLSCNLTPFPRSLSFTTTGFRFSSILLRVYSSRAEQHNQVPRRYSMFGSQYCRTQCLSFIGAKTGRFIVPRYSHMLGICYRNIRFHPSLTPITITGHDTPCITTWGVSQLRHILKRGHEIYAGDGPSQPHLDLIKRFTAAPFPLHQTRVSQSLSSDDCHSAHIAFSVLIVHAHHRRILGEFHCYSPLHWTPKRKTPCRKTFFTRTTTETVRK
jgi:hypothetical protein